MISTPAGLIARKGKNEANNELLSALAENEEMHKARKKGYRYRILRSLSNPRASFDVLVPRSRPRHAVNWSRIHIFTTKILCCASPTRMYELYLEGLFNANGLSNATVKLDSKTTMQCWRPRKPKNRPGSCPLLLLHGFGAAAITQWATQVGELAKKFDLYVPNLVFFGGSYSNSSDRSLQFQARCVVEVMDYFSIACCDIVGFSYGAAVAHRLTTGHPQRVRRVILEGEGIMMTRRDLETMQKQLGIDDGTGFWKLPSAPEDIKQLEEIAFRNPLWLPNFMYQDVINVMFSELQQEWKELVYEYTLDRPDDPSQNAVISKDCLLIWGEDDPMAPLNFGWQLKQHFGARCRMVAIKRARHMAHAQYPREFNQLVSQFLLSSDASVGGNKTSFILNSCPSSEAFEES